MGMEVEARNGSVALEATVDGKKATVFKQGEPVHIFVRGLPSGCMLSLRAAAAAAAGPDGTSGNFGEFSHLSEELSHTNSNCSAQAINPGTTPPTHGTHNLTWQARASPHPPPPRTVVFQVLWSAGPGSDNWVGYAELTLKEESPSPPPSPPPSPSPPAPVRPTCLSVLTKLCGADKSNPTSCLTCEVSNGQTLAAAGCTAAEETAFCRPTPPPPTPPPRPPPSPAECEKVLSYWCAALKGNVTECRECLSEHAAAIKLARVKSCWRQAFVILQGGWRSTHTASQHECVPPIKPLK
jgi:hypothetical protein